MGAVSAPSFFVFGAGRSGTSILQRSLSSHLRVQCMHEQRLLELGVMTGALVDAAGGPAIDLTAPRTLFGLELGRRYCALLGDEQAPITDKGETLFGDKYPPYCEQLPQIECLWPTAKFIHIIRDGRDVVASALQAFVANRGWRRMTELPTVQSIAANWATMVRTALDHGRRLSKERYCEVRYDELCREPAQVLERVFHFLGVDPGDTPRLAGERVRSSRSWQQSLSEDERDEFEACAEAAQLNAELGYPARIADPSSPRGVDPEGWAALGDAHASAGREADAMACYMRAVRTPEKSLRGLHGALAVPRRAESLFAALNARARCDEATCQALAEWLVARGLERRAARSLMQLEEVSAQ